MINKLRLEEKFFSLIKDKYDKSTADITNGEILYT